MSLITESKLRSFNKQQYNTVSLSAILESHRAQSKTNKTTIFLSHKHDESAVNLSSAIEFLKQFGVSVYVDWLDEGMPKNTSAKTAIKIKEKIKQNDKFILLATEEAINSKWCNWELGLGDAEKYKSNIALLVIEKDHGNYTGYEYLSIYPYIIYHSGDEKYVDGTYIPKGYYVRYPEERIIKPLKIWLKER